MDNILRQELIKRASQAYYSNGSSPLTDAEFDALLEEERKENPNSPLLGVGHGYDVTLTSGQKFPHKYGIVGSLPKCHNWGEYSKSLKNVKVCKTLKLDGISCVMYYRNGTMYQALTRGSDNIGIDITDKVKKIAPDYFTISDTAFTGAVRGEILMSFPEFDKFSATRENAENSRNSTSGLMGMKDVSEDLKYLSLIVYTVIGLEYTQAPAFYNYLSMHNWLVNNYGIDNVVPISESIYSNDAQFMEDMNLTRNAWYNKYPADGIVITLNTITFINSAVEYNAMAFKFPAETKETTITDIEWNLSKTKYLVPTIIVEPIRLSGATVSRAAGCNAKRVLDMKWGVGAKVKMTRSGEVIPYIESTVIPVTPELPATCPSCNSELIWDGVHLRCPNSECRDIQIQDLIIWCNNIAPIDGLGDTLKLKFFDELLDADHTIEGIYDYAEHYRNFDIDNSECGVQVKLFYKMLQGLLTNKVSIISALKALNIPRLGDATANSLSHYPDDIEKLIEGIIPDNLAQKIGDANSRSVIAHIDKFSRLNYIKDNLIFNEEISNNPRIPVAITGSLSIPRKQFETLINEKGFVVGSITKDTKYLITDNPDSGSSKNAKADKLGIEKITEVEFRRRFNI